MKGSQENEKRLRLVIDQQGDEIKDLRGKLTHEQDENRQHVKDKAEMQGVIDQHQKDKADMQCVIDQHVKDKADMQCVIDQHVKNKAEDDIRYADKCRECEKINHELAFEKGKNSAHEQNMDKLTKASLVNVNCNGTVSVHHQKPSDSPDATEAPTTIEQTATKPPPTTNEPPLPAHETFIDRTCAIARKIADNNGKVVDTRAKGRSSSYRLNFNAKAVCEALHNFREEYPEELKEFLGGKYENTQVGRVCMFLGHVIRMEIVNDDRLQMKDILFAFKGYYEPGTVQTRLSNKTCTDQELHFFRKFRVVLNRAVARIT